MPGLWILGPYTSDITSQIGQNPPYMIRIDACFSRATTSRSRYHRSGPHARHPRRSSKVQAPLGPLRSSPPPRAGSLAARLCRSSNTLRLETRSGINACSAELSDPLSLTLRTHQHHSSISMPAQVVDVEYADLTAFSARHALYILALSLGFCCPFRF